MRKFDFKKIFIVLALLFVLTGCGDEPEHVHTEVIDEGKAATCIETGLTNGIHCSTCKKVIVAQEEIPITEHSYKGATCDEPSTCTVCGATNGEALGHNFGDWYKSSDTEEKRDCDTCDYSETRSISAEHTHSYGNWQVTTNPECMTAGEERRYCSCGEYESKLVNATGHSYTDWYKVSDTEEKRNCNNCTHYETRTVLADHTHSYGNWQVTTSAGCMTAGEERRYCSCGQYESKMINATGHSYGEWKVSLAATCTNTGEERRTCSCGQYESRLVNALGHSFGEWTKISDTEEKRTCACGHSETRSISVEHTHSYGEWQVITPATCTVDGEEKRTCSCGDYETRAIAAKGHTYVSGVCSCGAKDPNYVAPEQPSNVTYAEAFAKVSADLLADLTTFFGTEVTKENCSSVFWKNKDTIKIPDFFMTNATYSTKWSWLKDFFIANGLTPTEMSNGTESYWRFEVQSFLNETVATTWPKSADYSSATVQAAFLAAYVAENPSTGGGSTGGGSSTESNPLLDADLAAITLPATLSSNYTYTNKGANGTTFTYISSNAGVLDDEGNVTQMLYDVDVTVRIIGTLNGVEKEKQVTVKVLKYELPEKSHQIILEAADFPIPDTSTSFTKGNGYIELASTKTTSYFYCGEGEEYIAPKPFTGLVVSWGAIDTSSTAKVKVEIKLRVNGTWSDYVSYGAWGFEGTNGNESATDSTGLIKISTDEISVLNSKTADAIRYKVTLSRSSTSAVSPKLKYLSFALNYSSYSYPVNVNHLPTSVFHSVPKLRQQDVSGIGSVICSATSTTMMLQYYGIDFTAKQSQYGYSLPHEYVARKVVYDSTMGGYGNWVYNTVAMSHYGFKSYVARFYSMEELMYELTKGPVALSIARCQMVPYEDGYRTYTHSGHLIVAVGYKYINGQLYITCNDPYANKVSEVTCNYSADLIKTYWKFIGYVIEK